MLQAKVMVVVALVGTRAFLLYNRENVVIFQAHLANLVEATGNEHYRVVDGRH